MWLQESKEWQELSLILRDYLNETVRRIAPNPTHPTEEDFQLIGKIVIKKFRRYQQQERYKKLSFMRLAVTATPDEHGVIHWNISMASGPCEVLVDYNDDAQEYIADLDGDYREFVNIDKLGDRRTLGVRLLPLDTEVH